MPQKRIGRGGRALFLALAIGMSVAGGSGPAGAAEITYDLDSPSAMKANLERYAGQRVRLRLSSGQDLEGTVTKVGSSAVHLAQLSGMDFFDAVVRIDQIAALIIRVRGGR